MAIKDVPTNFFLVAGKGDAEYELNAFDIALLDAGIGNTNIVRLSSILPPNARLIEPVKFKLGELISVAYASKISSIKGEIIAAAIAVAIPKDKSLNGLIMEHSGAGTAEEIENIVRDKARLGMEYRNYEIAEIKSISIEHTTVDIGAVFAGAVLL